MKKKSIRCSVTEGLCGSHSLSGEKHGACAAMSHSFLSRATPGDTTVKCLMVFFSYLRSHSCLTLPLWQTLGRVQIGQASLLARDNSRKRFRRLKACYIGFDCSNRTGLSSQGDARQEPLLLPEAARVVLQGSTESTPWQGETLGSSSLLTGAAEVCRAGSGSRKAFPSAAQVLGAEAEMSRPACN